MAFIDRLDWDFSKIGVEDVDGFEPPKESEEGLYIVQRWICACTFVGEMKDGLPNGKGMATDCGHEYNEDDCSCETGDYGNDQFVGNYMDGKREGYGEYTFASGDIVKGYWKEGKLQSGEYYYSGNRDNGGYRYVGNFVQSEPHTFVPDDNATIIYDDQSVYRGDIQGDWHNIKKHGIGKLVDASGVEKDGYWEDDEFFG
ncbi:MAG: hypothetical protein ACI4MY_06735 [Christensenellales bacterium]